MNTHLEEPLPELNPAEASAFLRSAEIFRNAANQANISFEQEKHPDIPSAAWEHLFRSMRQTSQMVLALQKRG